MKKRLSYVALPLLALVGMTAFSQDTPSPGLPAPNPAEFEQEPPIPTLISLKQDKALKQSLVILTFAKTSSRRDMTRLQGNRFQVAVGRETLTFRDDGMGGDRVARDGEFVSPIALTDQELLEFVKLNNVALERARALKPVAFVGRSAQPLGDFKSFDLEGFRAGKTVALSIPSSTTVNDNTLDMIRNKSLMITDVSVVEDPQRTFDACTNTSANPIPKGNPNGVWSFKTLISNIAANSGVTPKDYLVDWVDTQLFAAKTHVPSGDTSFNRPAAKARLIRAWIKNSNLASPPPFPQIPINWKSMNLKPEAFPVRLLAIVNRLDLRGNSGYGMSNAGEGRFVFCFVDSNANCSVSRIMTIILEYGIPIQTCHGLKDYAQKWWSLWSTPFGNAYNGTLEQLTRVFTDANVAPNKPNKSALNHLRTNEFINQPWEIRDFEINANTKKLTLIHPNKEPKNTTSSTSPTVPAASFPTIFPTNLGNNPSLAYSIPPTLAAMHAPMFSSGQRWFVTPATGASPASRREFSLNTCSGCHTGETSNAFTHVKPRQAAMQATLSGFMIGSGSSPMGFFSVPDVSGSPLPPKDFNEARRRAEDLESLVFNSPCPIRPFPGNSGLPNRLIGLHSTLMFQPLNSPH